MILFQIKSLRVAWAMLLVVHLPIASQAVEIYSHRGAAGLSPENTLVAYQTALAIGVDVVDMDIGMTKDPILIVTHDPKPNPSITQHASGQWLEETVTAFKAMAFSELNEFRVGALRPGDSYRNLYPLQQAVPDATIPSLKQVIRYIKATAGHNVRIQIEIKTTPHQEDMTPSPEAITPQLIKLLRAEGVTEQVEVHSFDWRNLQLLQTLAPDIQTSYLSDEAHLATDNKDLAWTAGHALTSRDDAIPQLIHTLGGKIWCPYFRDLTAEKLAIAKALGLRVNVWTVDAPEDMMAMIALDVDGIITNRPDILRGLLAAQGHRVPQSWPAKSPLAAIFPDSTPK